LHSPHCSTKGVHADNITLILLFALGDISHVCNSQFIDDRGNIVNLLEFIPDYSPQLYLKPAIITLTVIHCFEVAFQSFLWRQLKYFCCHKLQEERAEFIRLINQQFLVNISKYLRSGLIFFCLILLKHIGEALMRLRFVPLHSAQNTNNQRNNGILLLQSFCQSIILL
jgi:hypothetical protein